jgi:hypothetical protein
MIGPGGHGGEACGIVAVEPHRPGCQAIEGRRADLPLAIGPQVVLPESICNDPDYVHSARSICRFGLKIEYGRRHISHKYKALGSAVNGHRNQGNRVLYTGIFPVAPGKW